MRHLDLFSGIGGFSLAADWVWGAEHEIVAFVEIDPFCQKVLKKHWPSARIHGDIRTFTNTAGAGQLRTKELEDHGEDRDRGRGHDAPDKTSDYRSTNVNRIHHEQIDLLTGGFPCQPFSHAGKRKGSDDNRYLWPEMLRVIRESRPTWIVGENVAGIVNMALEQVCVDLEAEGYEVQPFIIPACGVNAPHKRDRVWIVAYRQRDAKGGSYWEALRRGLAGREDENLGQRNQMGSDTADDDRFNWETPWLEVATALCRVDDGVPGRVDRTRKDRLKSLGNAIVPQVLVPIYQAIKAHQ